MCFWRNNMIERIQYTHYQLPVIRKSIIYCSFTENNLKCWFSCFLFFLRLDLSKESLPGWSYMFELRDQNSNVSIVYDGVCKSRVHCSSPWSDSPLDSGVTSQYIVTFKSHVVQGKLLPSYRMPTLWILNPFLDVFGASASANAWWLTQGLSKGSFSIQIIFFSSGVEVGSQWCIFYFQIETLVYGIILGLNQYHIAFNVILEVRENCTIVVLIGQAE